MSYLSNPKIDNYATDGLLGVSNSLAYRVHEIEKHFHSEEHWYGTDGDGTGSTANNLDVWTTTAGTGEAYGAEVQLLGANDISNSDFSFTPVKFDAHSILVTTANQTDDLYMIQIWSGTGTFGEATLISEFPYYVASAFTESGIIRIQMPRQAVATKLWARCKCTANGGTISFIIGVHAYVG